MRRFVARFNFSCTLIGNRPQSLTGHIVKRYGQFKNYTMIRRVPLIFGLLSLFTSHLLSQSTAEDILAINKNLRLDISVKKDTYCLGESIIINYKILNISKKPQDLIIYNYMRFPLNMSVEIIDTNNLSICEYGSKHILASQVFDQKELEKFHKVVIKPIESIEGTVVLQDIPVLKNQSCIIPAGTYKIRVFFIALFSNYTIVKVIE